MDRDVDPVVQIRRIFEDVVSDGFRAEVVSGASDEEIDNMAEVQGVGTVPASVREVLRIMGKRAPVWFSGTAFGVDSMGMDTKRDALDCLDESESHDMRDPDNMLVLVDGGSYSYVVVDGVDLLNPDPPLWLLYESGRIERNWDSVTSWFSSIGQEVRDRKRRIADRRAMGRPDTAREAYFRWN